MRKIILVVVLCLGVIFLILYFSELQQIFTTIRRANPWYLAIALVIQVIWFAVVGLTYQSIYTLLGLKESRRHMVLLAVAANFVNVVTTSAGVGGMALFINDGQRRGQSSGKVTVAGVLYLLIDEASFLFVLTFGTIILARRNRLSDGDIAASLTLLAIACGIALFLYLGYRSAKTLGDVLARLARMINFIVRPFLRREYLSEARAHTFASEIADGLSSAPEKTSPFDSAFVFLVIWQDVVNGCADLCISILQYPFSRRDHRQRIFPGLFVPHRFADSFRHWHCGRSDGFGISFAKNRMGIGDSCYARVSQRDVLAAIVGGSIGVPHDQCAESGKGRERNKVNGTLPAMGCPAF